LPVALTFGAPPTCNRSMSKPNEKSSENKENVDSDEILTITLLRPSLESLIKRIEQNRRCNPKKSQRRKSNYPHDA
jgi:hypothetical protein